MSRCFFSYRICLRLFIFLLMLGVATLVQAGDLSAWQIINNMNQSREAHCAVTIDTCIYVLGAYDRDSTVERAFVNPDGSLTAWEYMNSMTKGKDSFAAVVYNNKIYAISSSIESASINSDFSLSPWTVISYLPHSLTAHAAVVWNDNIYLVGGYYITNMTTYNANTNVLRSQINPDGSLTPWEILSSSLHLPREYLAAVVYNDYIYTLGGNTLFGSWGLATVERAQIYPAGDVGPWAIETAEFIYYRMNHAGVMVNNTIYVLGGVIGGLAKREVERAPILTDGHLGAWQEVSSMVRKRQHLASVCVGNRYIYALGGFDTSELSSVEMAEILPTAINDSLWPLYK